MAKKPKKMWILMLYQVAQPQNVIQVGTYPNKQAAKYALNAMVSKNWCRSVVENSFGYNGVQAVIVEAEQAILGWTQ
jgi:hypothetical protein